MADPRRIELDRDLLRRAGEHLGSLAEQAREQWETQTHRHRHDRWDMHLKLSALSQKVLEIANG